MKQIRQALAAVAERLGLNRPLLKRAQRRRKKFRERAQRENRRQHHAEEVADRLRGEGHVEAAAQKDRKANRCRHRAFKSSQKSRWWLGRVKVLQQRIHKLEVRQEDLEAALKKLQREAGVQINGNKVTGGTRRQRLQACALASAAACASGRRRNFYSQPGRLTWDKCITGEGSGDRSDCSQWFTSVYYSCDEADPNGGEYGGTTYTGTLVMEGKQISTSELQPGDAIVYGSGTGYHVEMYVGPGDKTIGHGSAPIDAGIINLTGDGDYRCFTY